MGKLYIEERAVNLAHYIIDSKDTVRGAAKKFGVSKSTVHKDVSERLEKINPFLAQEVRAILDENKAERHIRGGMATKLKYSHETRGRFHCPTFGTKGTLLNVQKFGQKGHSLFAYQELKIVLL